MKSRPLFLMILPLLIASSCLMGQGKEESFAKYLEMLKEYPALGPSGDAKQGEIQILQDPKELAEIQEKMGRQVGIVAQDQYWIWINDAVQFPNGKKGIYGRMLWKRALQGTAGAAVMPILPDGRIVLNCNFRHATRSWELELPRGGANIGENIEDAARREVEEETGMVVGELHSLGDIAPDTGMISSVVPIYLAKVQRQQEATPEESEAIAEILAISPQELKKAFLKGHMDLEIKSETKKVYVRDPFLAFALFKADLEGHLD